MGEVSVQHESITVPDSVGSHEFAFTVWRRTNSPSGPDRPILFCCHGLTRNAADFAVIARSLAQTTDYTIVSVDIVGRGRSSWLSKKEDYGYALYVADCLALLKHVAPGRQVDWLGTSMGGFIGMMLGATPALPDGRSAIRKLIINDIGPFVDREPLLIIAGYAGKAPPFDSLEEAARYFARIHKGFGLDEAQWLEIVGDSVKLAPADSQHPGKFVVRYDPGIAHPFSDVSKIQDVQLWSVWDTIKSPVMIIRGGDSIVLRASTVEQMRQRGPGITEYLELPGVGHAPALTSPTEIERIRSFLLAA